MLATDNSVSHLFTDYKNFRSVIKLGFHHILRNNTETKGHLFCEPMRSMAVENGKAMLHLGFKTGTGGRDGVPLIKRHDI